MMNDQISGAGSVNTFVLIREVDAPRQLLFDLWTKKEHIEKWFGPAGSKIVNCTNDLKPGGMLHYGMEFSNGFVMYGRWVYKEIVPPEKLVFIVSFSDENKGIGRHPMAEGWPAETLSEIIFEDKNGKTLLKMSATPVNASEEEEKLFREGFGSMEKGWAGTFRQLEEYLDSIKK